MGKRYVAVIEFWDPEPSDNPEHDISVMLKYGWKHQSHIASLAELKTVEDYEEEGGGLV